MIIDDHGVLRRVVPEMRPGCVHEDPNHPDEGWGPGLPRFTNADLPQTWLPGSPVIPGTEWCWTHRQWETKEKL